MIASVYGVTWPKRAVGSKRVAGSKRAASCTPAPKSDERQRIGDNVQAAGKKGEL